MKGRRVSMRVLMNGLFAELSTAWTDTQKPKPLVDMKSLPSAPRAATAPKIDVSRLPKNPPFTVFIGNLSYEASEEDVKRHFDKHRLNVSHLYHYGCHINPVSTCTRLKCCRSTHIAICPVCHYVCWWYVL